MKSKTRSFLINHLALWKSRIQEKSGSKIEKWAKGGGTRPVRLWPEHFAGTRVGGYGTTEAAEADAGIPFLWSQDTSEANGRGRCQRIFRKMVEEFFKGIRWIVLEMVHRRLGRTNFSV
jgi:hypothetical protein